MLHRCLALWCLLSAAVAVIADQVADEEIAFSQRVIRLHQERIAALEQRGNMDMSSRLAGLREQLQTVASCVSGDLSQSSSRACADVVSSPQATQPRFPRLDEVGNFTDDHHIESPADPAFLLTEDIFPQQFTPRIPPPSTLAIEAVLATAACTVRISRTEDSLPDSGLRGVLRGVLRDHVALMFVVFTRVLM
jgi:hypothetical protein